MTGLTKIVLICESPELRASLKKTMESGGLSVYLATDIPSAMDLFQNQGTGALVCDYSFAGSKAEDLISQVKTIRANLPVVILTDQTSHAILVNLIRFENLAIMHRPIDSDQVVEVLNKLVESLLPYRGAENRQFRRVDTEIEAELGEYGQATITNLSVGGLFICTQKEFEYGDLIRVKIPAMKNLSIDGKVVWKRDQGNTQNLPKGFGLKFTNVESKDLNRIKDFIFERVASAAIFEPGESEG